MNPGFGGGGGGTTGALGGTLSGGSHKIQQLVRSRGRFHLQRRSRVRSGAPPSASSSSSAASSARSQSARLRLVSVAHLGRSQASSSEPSLPKWLALRSRSASYLQPGRTSSAASRLQPRLSTLQAARRSVRGSDLGNTSAIASAAPASKARLTVRSSECSPPSPHRVSASTPAVLMRLPESWSSRSAGRLPPPAPPPSAVPSTSQVASATPVKRSESERPCAREYCREGRAARVEDWIMLEVSERRVAIERACEVHAHLGA